MHRIRRTTRNERGATLIVTALSVPVLIAFGAVAVGITSLWTSHHDVQRAADLAALSAAANSPTLSLDIPVSGSDWSCPVSGDADPSSWRERPNAVVAQQLTDGRSIVSTAYGEATPDVCAQWQYESPLLAMLGFCTERLASELGECRDRFDEELRASLPVVNDLDDSAMSAVEAVRDLLDPRDKLVDRRLAALLGDACVDEIGGSVLGVSSWECLARFEDVMASIDHRTGSLLQVVNSRLAAIVSRLQATAQRGGLDPLVGGIGFDPIARPQVPSIRPADMAPALVTPRVQVDISDLDFKPPLSPFSFDVESTATARRQIKSALVLPSLGIPGIPEQRFGELSAETQLQLTDKLGADVQLELELAYERAAEIIDPQVYTHDAKVVADSVLDEIDALDPYLSEAVHDSLCTSLPMDISCPVGDDVVNRQHLMGPFMEDLRDATQPPPERSPTVQELLAEYAESEQVVWVVSGLTTFITEDVLGADLFEVLANPQGVYDGLPDPPTNVSGLISPLMFIPALDVVPATIVRDGDLFMVQRVDRQTVDAVAATSGLYKARLVR